MLTFLPPFVRGCISGLIMCSNTAVISVPIFGIALLKVLIPWRPWRRFCSDLLNSISAWWIGVNSAWMRWTQKMDWQVEGAEGLQKDGWYLVSSNHQAWADIYIAQYLLNRRIPQMKFFLKQELIWVPVIGLCWWALDFPFMKRYSKSYLKKHPEKIGQDLETTRKACEKFSDTPVAIFNFMEGTRFSEAKHKRQNSPYRHLLKPRAGGTGYVLSAMGHQLKTLVDITIHYDDGVPGFWQFLCGCTGKVTVHIDQVEIPAELLDRNYNENKEFRAGLQRWVKGLWAAKDERLTRMRQDAD